VADTQVVVVGAGLAGLVAARTLVREGTDVVVLEARDRVGGRTLNDEIAGVTVEVGGQWVGPGQDRMYELIADLGLETFPTYDEGHGFLEARGAVRAMEGSNPPFGPFALADLFQAQRRLEKLVDRVPLDAPWTASPELDAETFASWVRRRCRTEDARAFYEIVSEAVFATRPANMALLHVLTYVASGQGLESLLGTGGGAQQDRVVGGTQLVSLRMAEELGDVVQLSRPVWGIAQDEAGVRVETEAGAVSADRVIVALPPTLAGRLGYEPAMPAVRDQLTQRLPHGYVIKVMVAYDRPWWRDKGMAGQATSADGPIGVVFDNSVPGSDVGILVGFFEGEHGAVWGRRTPVARRQAFVDCLVRWFGPEAAKPVDYVERDWAAEEWTRGCYGAHFPPGVWTQYGPALREPVGRIHWAGSETAVHWMGYMDGALESGERAAHEVLEAG